jgi:glutathione synthase/RimK-type ligase-like ATP-grasp enzyme
VITQDFDPTVDPVVELLTRRGSPPVRFDLSDFPQEMTVCSDGFSSSRWLRVRGHEVDLDEVTSVWYRRPTFFKFDEGLLDNEREFATTESALGVGGLFRSMDSLWVNRPDAESVASLKPYQLHLARAAGLTTPKTLITNDPDTVRRVRDSGERLVYKIFGGGVVQVAGEIPAMVFTTDISDVDDAALDRIRHTPCIVQELVAKRTEVRMTVVGRTLLVANIDSQSNPATLLDWREAGNEGLRYGPPEHPPEHVVDATMRLMDTLGIPFGTLDFILTEDDEWVFLEVNPNGQFMWLEEELGLPMTETMADLLTGGSKKLLDDPVVITA